LSFLEHPCKFTSTVPQEQSQDVSIHPQKVRRNLPHRELAVPKPMGFPFATQKATANGINSISHLPPNLKILKEKFLKLRIELTVSFRSQKKAINKKRIVKDLI
jgi:hypothetical protein